MTGKKRSPVICSQCGGRREVSGRASDGREDRVVSFKADGPNFLPCDDCEDWLGVD